MGSPRRQSLHHDRTPRALRVARLHQARPGRVDRRRRSPEDARARLTCAASSPTPTSSSHSSSSETRRSKTQLALLNAAEEGEIAGVRSSMTARGSARWISGPIISPASRRRDGRPHHHQPIRRRRDLRPQAREQAPNLRPRRLLLSAGISERSLHASMRVGRRGCRATCGKWPMRDFRPMSSAILGPCAKKTSSLLRNATGARSPRSNDAPGPSRNRE
jgi:hypothetical protein